VEALCREAVADDADLYGVGRGGRGDHCFFRKKIGALGEVRVVKYWIFENGVEWFAGFVSLQNRRGS
jgi:hypothetical protein